MLLLLLSVFYGCKRAKSGSCLSSTARLSCLSFSLSFASSLWLWLWLCAPLIRNKFFLVSDHCSTCSIDETRAKRKCRVISSIDLGPLTVTSRQPVGTSVAGRPDKSGNNACVTCYAHGGTVTVLLFASAAEKEGHLYL